MDLCQLSSYHFDLPEELIAQQPCPQRDSSRVLVVDRARGELSEMRFCDLADFLQAEDSLVLNNTKVLPARLRGRRSTGGAVEILLLRPQSNGSWEAMARPGKKLRSGEIIELGPQLSVEILDTLENGHKIVRLQSPLSLEDALDLHGEMPLPPYIKRGEGQVEDHKRYQTVFAQELGAVAAPTAGLHFTEELLGTLAAKGVQRCEVTLHVGPGTFRPMQVDNVLDHDMHSEHYHVSSQAAEQLNARSAKGRQICIGTTCVRTLESAANSNGIIEPGAGDTELFIYPGYQFRYVEQMLTNFHLPGSTLLMLVCAFAGYDLMMEAYRKAVCDRFRFFSYGDAMLIL